MSRACKGCSASVHLTAAEVEALFQGQKPRSVKVVSAETCTARLAACRSCASLLYGTTCAHCGCLVGFKAKLAAADCPDPFGSHWLPIEK